VWRFFGQRKRSRNQWADELSASRETYDRLMALSWDELRAETPDYFARLSYSVEKARGQVLELGCGIGTMTRWLAASDAVEGILAVDAYEVAIRDLDAVALPKTSSLVSDLAHLRLEEGQRFDTVMLCEVLEHLYAGEERAMLKALRPHVDSETRFVVSTPIGFMPDPHHVRGFTKKKFRRHIAKRYGEPLEIDYASGYSQCAFGTFR
jgi:2-polyprenyl-3-methyl-5-hydroxy-6-metoxy-1,4-benzoquinol methylase